MKHKTSRARQKDAERATEHWLRQRFGCVNTVRAVNTKFQRQDLFAADCLGLDPSGRLIAAQVTCGKSQAVRARRRKMEAVAWSKDHRVFVLELRSAQYGRGKRFWFRVHELWCCSRKWVVWKEDVDVSQAWFRAWKNGAARTR